MVKPLIENRLYIIRLVNESLEKYFEDIHEKCVWTWLDWIIDIEKSIW